jgi:hypothetical protein
MSNFWCAPLARAICPAPGKEDGEMIIRSWNLRPRPGRYDDAVGLITEGIKLADRHGAREIRVTQAATAGPNTGLLVLTCEFDDLTAYGTYLDDTSGDPEAQSYSHRIREAEAPFTYESTAVLVEIDLQRSDAKNGRGQVLDARLGRPRPGRWDDTLTFAREAFDLCDAHGAAGCRLFELNHAGPQSGLLCAVMEYDSMRAFGQAGDAWMADDAARRLTGTMRGDSPFEPVSSGLFTEVDVL